MDDKDDLREALGLPEGMEVGIMDGHFHGFKVSIVAVGKRIGDKAYLRPLAVMLAEDDMAYVTGPHGESMIQLDQATGRLVEPDSKLDADIRAGYL